MSWKSTLEDVIAHRRRAMGDPPSLDELIDLRQGRLSADQRERVLERAAVDPEVAQDLLDIVDYPNLPSADDEPDGERRAERWRRFQERLRAEDPDPFGQGSADPGELPQVLGRSAAARRPRWLGVAASLAIGAVVGAFLWQILRPSSTGPGTPVGNVEILSLSLDQSPGSRGGRVELPGSAEWTLLTFGSARLPAASEYSILVRDRAGAEVWRRDGLVVGTGGLLTVLIPAEVFPPGGYRAEIYPDGDFEGKPAATATWTVAATVP